MIFSENSNVTVVITSCNRFDLLKKTLLSFSKKNTYPIKKLIIVEDSGNKDIYKIIPKHWLPNTHIIINKEKLGQIESIDKAYAYVDSDYIFHCEDDWFFYREGFIEDSLTIMNSDLSIVTVWLRDINNDVCKNYPFHFITDEKIINNIVYYKLNSSSGSWRGFTFNPTLKRISDYKKINKYKRPFFSAGNTESFLSVFYDATGMQTMILKESAVKHIGWNHHIQSQDEKNEYKIKKIKKIKHLTIGFIFGFCVFLLLFFLIK